MIILNLSVNTVRVLAFILSQNLDCTLHTEIYNGENIYQVFLISGTLESLEKIAQFCYMSDIQYLLDFER